MSPRTLPHAKQEYLGNPEGYDLDFNDWLVDAQRFVGQWSPVK